MLPIFATVLCICLLMSECDFLKPSRALGPQGLGQLLAHPLPPRENLRHSNSRVSSSEAAACVQKTSSQSSLKPKFKHTYK